jgi:NADH dehydrogenase
MAAAADGDPGRARHRVVIIGAGFGGLFATRALRRVPVEVTVVDRTNHHLFQPLLYQVVTGVLSEGDIAPPIREVRNQRNARVLLGQVVHIDLGAREVVLETIGDRTCIPYDSLIVASEFERLDAWLTFVVVGAGPTGVELAGQIAELSRRALKGNYRSFDPRTARIVLVEATDTVLASFPEPLQRRARHDLERD